MMQFMHDFDAGGSLTAYCDESMAENPFVGAEVAEGGNGLFSGDESRFAGGCFPTMGSLLVRGGGSGRIFGG